MQMHISIDFDHRDKDIMLAVVEALSLAKVATGAQSVWPGEVQVVEPEFQEPGELHPMTNGGELVNDVREVIPAMDAAAARASASGPVTAKALVKKFDASYKRAATGTAKDSTRLKEEDEVVDPDGQVGIIAALYRGRAVVQYDDGTGAEFGTSMLLPYEGVDEQVEQEEADEPDPLDDDIGVPVVITRDELREIATAFMEKKGGTALQTLMVKHTGSTKVSAIPEAQLGVLANALRAEMARA